MTGTITANWIYVQIEYRRESSGLAGDLGRCTVYDKIVRAVQDAAAMCGDVS